MSPEIQLRPIKLADQEFLFSVFVSTRPDIIHSDLPDEQKLQLMRMQFGAQHQDYTTNYPDANFLIISLGRTPIGRLYVHHRPKQIHVLEISLLPDSRRKGIGTQLLSQIIKQAEVARKSVTLYVEKMDGAIDFYRRLGFTTIEEIETHFLMEFRPKKPIVVFTSS